MKLRLQVLWCGLWFLFVYFFFLYKDYLNTKLIPFELSTLSILTFLFSLTFIYFLVESVCYYGRSAKEKSFVFASLMTVYALLGFYHFKTSHYFDFSIIADHWKSIWKPGSFKESFKVIDKTFSGPDYFWSTFAVLVGLGFLKLDLRRNYRGVKWAPVACVLSFYFLDECHNSARGRSFPVLRSRLMCVF